MITLFALVLAIGIVVDDAIVVVEAVHAKMDEEAPIALRRGKGSDRRNQRGHYRHYHP
ncbi:MAG: efflux RND transporter permease subunit [Hymenobacter sp.]